MTTNVHVFLPRPDAALTSPYTERHAFGPAPEGYHTDLEIGIPAAAVASAPALAALSGVVRVLNESRPGGTCTLVLKPFAHHLRNLSRVLRGGIVVFVYRNLDPASIRTFYPDKFPRLAGESDADYESRVQSIFTGVLSGDRSAWYAGGSPLGLARLEGPTASLGFEIAFVPNGLGDTLFPMDPHLSSGGWGRIFELVKPGNTATRRLDPATFYGGVAAGSDRARLAAGDSDHPLLDLLTKRILLELRDEYDLPYQGEAVVLEGGAAEAKLYSFTEENQGTVELETDASGAAVSYTVTIPRTDAGPTQLPNLARHVLTELPSGTVAQAAPSREMSAPSHWALQAIFMADEDDPANWFMPNNVVSRQPELTRFPRFTPGNKVTPIRDGVEVFSEYVTAIRTVSPGQPHQFVYLVDWQVMDDFELVPHDFSTTTLRNLTKMAAGNGATVRALFWEGKPQVKVNNDMAIDNMNRDGTMRAIKDGRTLFAGSHHQKILIVKGNDSPVAFCGGVDIVPNRLDSPAHRALGGFHDVHAKVEGPAVADIHRTFVERWNAHPDNAGQGLALPVALPNSPPTAGTIYVQVARTYPNGAEYRAFAPESSFGPLNAAIRAFSRARKFIYIEDQYLTPFPGKPGDHDSVGILDVLQEALKRIDYLIIVIPNHATQPGNRFHRRIFIQSLLDADQALAAEEAQASGQAQRPPKVHVFYLGRNRKNEEHDDAFDAARAANEVATKSDDPDASGGEHHRDEIYCHSKVWIVDDVCAKIGSANMCRRSYTHDSEIDIVMVDGALTNGARAFARALRIELWAEHLNLTEIDAQVLEDHLLARDFWLNLREGAHIRPYQLDVEAEDNSKFYERWEIVDPDGR